MAWDLFMELLRHFFDKTAFEIKGSLKKKARCLLGQRASF